MLNTSQWQEANNEGMWKNMYIICIHVFLFSIFRIIFKQLDLHCIDKHKLCNLENGTPRKSRAQGDRGGHVE